jgi:hypothetical protein
MLHTRGGSQLLRRFELHSMPLPVIEAQGTRGKALLKGNRQHGGGIQPTAQQDNGFRFSYGQARSEFWNVIARSCQLSVFSGQ